MSNTFSPLEVQLLLEIYYLANDKASVFPPSPARSAAYRRFIDEGLIVFNRPDATWIDGKADTRRYVTTFKGEELVRLICNPYAPREPWCSPTGRYGTDRFGKSWEAGDECRLDSGQGNCLCPWGKCVRMAHR